LQLHKLKIEGTGYGLNFVATFGEFKTVVDPTGSTRVFVAGDEKGVVVGRGFRIPTICVLAKIQKGGELIFDKSLNAAQMLFQTLRDEFRKSYRGLVRVYSGGDVAGSILAGKVKIKLTNETFITRTVPASQVEAIDGKLWLPKWLVLEKTREILEHTGCSFTGERCIPSVLEEGILKMESELIKQVALLTEKAKQFQAIERIEAPLRAKHALEALEAQRIKKVFEQEDLKKRLARKVNADAKAALRLSNLPIHAQGVNVRGKDWETKKGRMYSTDWEIKGATVRVAGTRAYIFQDENAKEPRFWKPLHTLQIEAAD
jgi:hypothetical protein